MTRSTRPAGGLIRLGAIFCMIAAAMAALGVLSIANVIRGGVALGIFTLLIAAAVFGLAGYFFWGYRWLAMHPGKLRQAEQETLFKSRMQRKPDEST
jgi:hypothetical protein